MKTQNCTRYSRSLTYSATAPKSRSMRSGATPNSYMPVGSIWSRRFVQESWTPDGTEPLASSARASGLADSPRRALRAVVAWRAHRAGKNRRPGSPRGASAQVQTDQGCQLVAVKGRRTKTPEPRPSWWRSPAGTEGGSPDRTMDNRIYHPEP